MEREREDSSNYVTQQPTPPDSHEEPQPVTPVEPPKKKSKAASILAGLLVLALLLAGTMAWLWYQQSGRVDNLEADLSKARNDVSRLESAADAEEQLDESDSVTTDTTSSDSEASVTAALLYEKAKTSTQSAELKGEFEKKSGKFARVAVSAPASGQGAVVVYLKQVDTEWIVVGDSTDDFEMLQKDFGIPDDMLSAS